MDIYEHHDWARVRELIKTWPGARRLTPAELDTYVDAIVYPNGRDRAARTEDPVELEQTLLELMQESEDRPSIPVIAARLGLRRVRANAELAVELDAVYTSEPAEDWVLAHAIALDLPLAGLMAAVARRHGRNPHPAHDTQTCELCAVIRLESAKELSLALEHGDDWRRIEEARREWETFTVSLDERFPWRV